MIVFIGNTYFRLRFGFGKSIIISLRLLIRVGEIFKTSVYQKALITTFKHSISIQNNP